MNIFAVNACPERSARDLPDKLLVKMVLETAQILSTVHRLHDGDGFADRMGFYKKTHPKHPSVAWAGECVANYDWLARHLSALCLEYSVRYYRTHKVESSMLMNDLVRFRPQGIPAGTEITKLPVCMPDEFKVDDEEAVFPVLSYRQYLTRGKSYVRDSSAWKHACFVPAWYSMASQPAHAVTAMIPSNMRQEVQ